jgi:hypothetical protein
MAFAANEVWDFAACQPARAMWEEVVGAHCAAPLAGWVVGYTTNGKDYDRLDLFHTHMLSLKGWL